MGRAPVAEDATYPYDLSTGTEKQAATTASKSTARRQTLMSLIEALLNKEGLLAEPDVEDRQLNFQDDRDVPTVDEHLQKVGAEAFNKFQKRITNLDRELRNFANAARQLGSSVGILSSSFYLRERLAQILHLFRENAADLFPRKVSHQSREVVQNVRQWKRHRRHRKETHIMNPKILEDVDPEDFPKQLEAFAVDVKTFLDSLNEFPEFNDEAVNVSIEALEGDLKYWASCLKSYEGQFRFPAVQRYLHDLSAEMGDHIDNITSSLSVFIEIGVPTIRFAQKHAAANLLNLSTVATFFSAVTATTMQFSFDDTSSPLANSVNGFWFTSLVFSIGAAVNSLLGLTWKQAMYRSPGNRVPWWVLIWIKRSPLVFLVLSVACFSIGLVLFAYSSGQSRVTSTVTTVFSACSCFGLVAVSTWFASERWIFVRHEGKKWLADILSETKIQLYGVPTAIVWQWCVKQARRVNAGMRRAHSATLQRFNTSSSSEKFNDIENGTANGINIRTCGSPEPLFSPISLALTRASDSGPLLPVSMGSPTLSVLPEGQVAPAQGPSPATRRRFQEAVRHVVMMNKAAGYNSPFSLQSSPVRRRTASGDGQASSPQEVGAIIRRSRVAALVPKLKSLQTTQDLAAHQALVRHMQFSPNGQFLATSSWDRTSVVFRVGDPFTVHRILAQPQGFVGQVAWSPKGTMLLTKLNRFVKIWTQDGVCKKTIDRGRIVQSITWLPGAEAFMSVENSFVVKLDLNGTVLEQYEFERMRIHDVAVTQDGRRMLCVGTLVSSTDGLHPSKCRDEKQIIAYNLEKKEIENRVPVLHDVRDITLARNDQVALVSYEDKAPPQLWKIEMIKSGTRINAAENDEYQARLSLRHTYMPKVPVDFAGPSYFGGKNDQLVLCAGKAGDIHIWDRESAALLHHVRAQVLGGDLTCVAWNHAVDSFMFATGSHDGAVRIWTAPHADGTLDDGPSRASTHPTSTPRTASPSPYRSEDRSEDRSENRTSVRPSLHHDFHLNTAQDKRAVSFVS